MTMVFDSIPFDSQFNGMPYLLEYKTRSFPYHLKNWRYHIITYKVKQILYRFFLNIENCIGMSYNVQACLVFK